MVNLYRDENVLIIGSGSAVHNLEGWRSYGDKPPPSYVFEFDKEMENLTIHLTVSGKKKDKTRTVILIFCARERSALMLPLHWTNTPITKIVIPLQSILFPLFLL